MTNDLHISPSGLMNIQTAAEYLGVTVATMRWLRRTKQVTFYKLGARLMVKQPDLDNYLQTVKEPAVQP